MKILQISLFYHPDKTGIAVTSTEVAEWFANNGHNVTVICGPPFYPEWKKREDYQDIKVESINNVEIKRTSLFVPKRINFITRLLHEISFTCSLFLNGVKLKKHDIIILVSPPLSAGFATILLKFIWGSKLILNVQDLVPDAAIELGMLTNNLAIKFFYYLERFVYRKADGIVAIGNGILKRIEKKGVPKEKLVFVPNTVDPFLLNAEVLPKVHNKFLNVNEIKDEFIVLHSGNIGVKQGVDNILFAAKELVNYSISFYIVGDGVNKKEAMSFVKKHKLNNVKFLPLQPREFLADLYHAANICLLTQKKEVVDIVVPSKLLSMMAAGSFIIAAVNKESEAARIIIESNGGIIIEPENPYQLSEWILHFFNNPHERIPLKKNAKKYISKNFDRDIIMTKYSQLLSELVE